MKFYIIILKFLVGILFTAGLLIIYDGYILFEWVKSKLIDKFELNVVLSTNEDVENLVREIKNFESKDFKFKEINFITKEDLFNEMKQNPEFSSVLSVIEENPFFDFIKIKFTKYSETEFTRFLSIIKSRPFVKEIIFDYNIKSYLSRLSEFERNKTFIVKFFYIFLILVGILQIIVFLKEVKTLYLRTIFFTTIYILSVLTNLKILDFIMSLKIKVGYYDVIFFVLVYIISALLVNGKE